MRIFYFEYGVIICSVVCLTHGMRPYHFPITSIPLGQSPLSISNAPPVEEAGASRSPTPHIALPALRHTAGKHSEGLEVEPEGSKPLL